MSKINYEQSLDILNNIKFENLPTQKLFVTNAIDRILATNIIADHNLPAYPTSGMDGYAIKHEDLEKGKIKIIDFNPAGTEIESEVISNTCIKTFTGSLMPKGSDTLIPIENVTVENDMIIINEVVPFGFATREVGEAYKKDEVLIKKGAKIGYAQIGVMASLNISQVSVYCQPTVAIASTGSEILDLGEEQTNKAQIRSSNHLTLEAIAKQNGADVHQMGVVKDDRESITNLLKNALLKADIVVTTGGVSVGDYDYVKDIIKDELGSDVLFQGVNIKPGQHILFARKGDKFIIGLPGFAYSSTVTFMLYVLPLIYKFQGGHQELEIIKATITENFPKKAPKTIFTACNLINNNGSYEVNFDGKKVGTSAILTNMLDNCGLLYQKEDSAKLEIGDIVEVIKV
jgi:molybdopterin molybdotransferase